MERDLQANRADLPTARDWGYKRNSKGKAEYWLGYKAHLDAIDGDIPRQFHSHLAFGLLVIAAEQMLKMLG